jgi:hypothetical protein
MSLSGYPEGQPKSFANQFADNAITATSTAVSTGALQYGAAFGFGAGLMKLVVDSGGPAYVRINSTGPATTADYKLTSGDLLTDWYNVGVPFSGVALCATSTGLNARVGAWG